MTNPPFGSDIPITDPQLLRDYDLARKPGKAEDDFAWGTAIKGQSLRKCSLSNVRLIG